MKKVNYLLILIFFISAICINIPNEVNALPGINPQMDDSENGGSIYAHKYNFGRFSIDIPYGGTTLVVVNHYAYSDINYNLLRNYISKYPTDYDYLGATDLTMVDQVANGNFAYVKARVTYPVRNPLTNDNYYYGTHAGRTTDSSVVREY